MVSHSSRSGARSPLDATERDHAASLSSRSRQRRQRARWVTVALAIVGVTAGVWLLPNRGGDRPTLGAASDSRVGGDLHTVTVVGSALYVGGHDAVIVSGDGGRQWRAVPSLAGADAMGWALTGDTVFVGGHPGLYRSADKGATFTKVTGSAEVPDVHALGGTGRTLYLASP